MAEQRGAPLQGHIEYQSRVFKALGHPARLSMVHALCGGERCVCDLRDLVDLDMSTVSKHLSVLREAGVVLAEKRGNWNYYRLALPCVPGFLHCLGQREDEQRATDIPLSSQP
ncbi:MAG: metalloregulator ArsR/SmtB family transcription factor [Desulfovibrionaceae bacterium]